MAETITDPPSFNGSGGAEIVSLPLGMSDMGKKKSGEYDIKDMVSGTTGDDIELQISGEDGRTASVFSSTVNMVNVIVGGGILALPRAFSECGIILALILLVFSAATSFLGLHFLTSCYHKIGGTKNSIGDLVARTFPKLSIIVDIMMAVLCFGVAVSYLTVVGDLGPQLAVAIGHIGPDSVWNNRMIYIGIGFAVFGIPLGTFRNLNSLRFISGIAVVSVLYVTILVILFKIAPTANLSPCDDYINSQSCRGGDVSLFRSGLGVLGALPVFVIAFCAHTNINSIYNEIAQPSVRRVDQASFFTLLIVFFLYVLIGLSGYLTYGNLISSNILMSYPKTIPVTIGRVFVLVLVLFSYPALTQPTRQSIINILKYLPAPSKDKERTELIHFWGATVFVLLGTFTVSLFVSNLGVVLGVIGSTVGSLATLILPGSLYFANFYHRAETVLDKFQLGCAVLMTSWGVVFIPLALYSIFGIDV